MDAHGSTLVFPFQADERGTLRTTRDPAVMAEQYIRDLVMTRVNERMQTLDYGVEDRVFAVKGAGFAALLAAEIKDKARDYLRVAEIVEVLAGEVDGGGAFRPGYSSDPYAAAVRISYRVAGESAERELLFRAGDFRRG